MAEHAPLFDPEVHTDPDAVVRLEMCCACGHVHQQVDPVRYCLPFVASFARLHSGPGHKPVSGGDAMAEREQRRYHAMRSVGAADDYTPRERDNPPAAAAWDWQAAGAEVTL